MFSAEVVERFKTYCDLMKKLAYHRKRQDEKHYWLVWDELVALKAWFLALNGPGEHWD